MLVTPSIEILRDHLDQARAAGHTIGLVPTMGALHAGHLRLVHEAHRHSDTVVVSIFVNPIQFNQSEDFARYPRRLDDDLGHCQESKVACVFTPHEADMYPEPARTTIDVAYLTAHLCGATRPGHFRGVATVVMKLLQVVQPDRAYFGEKDAQQLAVVTRMVRDLNVPVTIIPVPTVREADGLALSSRNAFLTPQERQLAPLLHQSLQNALKEPDPRTAGRHFLAQEPAFRIEYLELVNADMQPIAHAQPGARLALAAWLGRTRLIDNIAADAVR